MQGNSVNKKLFIGLIVAIVVIVILSIVLIITTTNHRRVDGNQAAVTQENNSLQGSEGGLEDTEQKEGEETVNKEQKGYIISYQAGNTWENNGVQMATMDISIKNAEEKSISNWTLEIEIDDLKSCEGWNGSYQVSDNKLTITNAEYNGELAAGETVTLGCNIGTGSPLSLKSARLNGVECIVREGAADSGSKDSNQNNEGQDNKENSDNTDGKSAADLTKRSAKAKQGDDWLHTKGNRILDKDNKEVWLTGVNWFGYNTGTNIFDGLWNSELKSSVQAIADHGFNLIRVPMSAQLINQWAKGEYPKANYNQAYNPELNSLNSLEIFDYFLKLAEENGIKVMPDIHSAETDASGHTKNLWYTDKVSTKEYFKALEWMAARYKDNDTIIAYDLKNEPHGKPDEGSNAAIWNDSKAENNWKYIAQEAALKVLAKNPNVLVLVEGTEIYPKNIKKNSSYASKDAKDYYFNWWGGNLRGVKDYPVDLGKYQDKLVYSPHDYGPTVYEQDWFKGSYSYDSLMKDCWRDNWFYIHEKKLAPLLIGEWGGFMKEPNLTWMTDLRKLIKTYHLNHTFWCFNANSGDTGGLVLDDFVTWDEEKYKFVKEVLWQDNGKFVGLDHEIPLGKNGITLKNAKGL